MSLSVPSTSGVREENGGTTEGDEPRKGTERMGARGQKLGGEGR